MKTAQSCVVVLVTVPDKKTARRLARKTLEARAAACANLIPKVESHYWWEDQIERSAEALIIFKTTAGGLSALEAVVREHHPYEVPEMIALPMKSGMDAYLDWLGANCAAPSAPKPASKGGAKTASKTASKPASQAGAKPARSRKRS